MVYMNGLPMTSGSNRDRPTVACFEHCERTTSVVSWQGEVVEGGLVHLSEFFSSKQGMEEAFGIGLGQNLQVAPAVVGAHALTLTAT